RLVACGLFGYAILAFPVYAKHPLRVGDVPPESLGRASTGGKVKLSDYRGKIVIISFWASWCSPCRKELPVLAAIQKNARDKIMVFAVNWKEDGDRYRTIVKTLKGVDLTFVSDESGYFGGEYDVNAIPHMVIIGRDGRIAAIHVGYGESEIPALVNEINGLWNQSSGPAPSPGTTSASPEAGLPNTDSSPK
ncbi:MAG: TlpA family protein disulfide reductase, partial [Sinobacteraceae bacterium]|nr:TlpA family protein disulfide reductase [Nevskiaceae bacterium]